MLVDCSLVARNGFTRCQGCFVDNKEIKAVVDDIKAQQTSFTIRTSSISSTTKPKRKPRPPRPRRSTGGTAKPKAMTIFTRRSKTDIMAQEYTSISRIQRSYGVGFPRAGKIFARLQAEGVVALQPDTASSKGCRVLLIAR
jgi:DNA segregation ATPase FtsK/SpoIIIE-like protein